MPHLRRNSPGLNPLLSRNIPTHFPKGFTGPWPEAIIKREPAQSGAVEPTHDSGGVLFEQLHDEEGLCLFNVHSSENKALVGTGGPYFA